MQAAGIPQTCEVGQWSLQTTSDATQQHRSSSNLLNNEVVSEDLACVSAQQTPTDLASAPQQLSSAQKASEDCSNSANVLQLPAGSTAAAASGDAATAAAAATSSSTEEEPPTKQLKLAAAAGSSPLSSPSLKRARGHLTHPGRHQQHPAGPQCQEQDQKQQVSSHLAALALMNRLRDAAAGTPSPAKLHAAVQQQAAWLLRLQRRWPSDHPSARPLASAMEALQNDRPLLASLWVLVMQLVAASTAPPGQAKGRLVERNLLQLFLLANAAEGGLRGTSSSSGMSTGSGTAADMDVTAAAAAAAAAGSLDGEDAGEGGEHMCDCDALGTDEGEPGAVDYIKLQASEQLLLLQQAQRLYQQQRATQQQQEVHSASAGTAHAVAAPAVRAAAQHPPYVGDGHTRAGYTVTSGAFVVPSAPPLAAGPSAAVIAPAAPAGPSSSTAGPAAGVRPEQHKQTARLQLQAAVAARQLAQQRLGLAVQTQAATEQELAEVQAEQERREGVLQLRLSDSHRQLSVMAMQQQAMCAELSRLRQALADREQQVLGWQQVSAELRLQLQESQTQREQMCGLLSEKRETLYQ